MLMTTQAYFIIINETVRFSRFSNLSSDKYMTNKIID